MHDDEVARDLDMVVAEVAAGKATVRMRVTRRMVNGHGLAHGGYIFLLADTAFAYACNSHGPVTLARSADIVFLEPAHEGDELVAVATEQVRRGRSGVYDVAVADGGGRLIALFRGQSSSAQERGGGPPAG